jgi:curli production assembly/transport component CsgG
MPRYVLLPLLLALLAAFGSGCVSATRPFEATPAHPGLGTPASDRLAGLPPPREKVVVAVYRFRDQTGQYKATDAFSTFSTAVTQGGTAILMRALAASGWFTPIEREGLSNLLNERQIIQSTRSQHDGEGAPGLRPLLYAGVLLEGGVVGYDTNVITGGAGVRYFGAGASAQVRQDQVTVSLRAVSTQTGRVLATVTATKTILSQKVDAGVFRFVDVERLLEAEAGYSFNEPPVLAVTEAIEEAVLGLVAEGVRDGLWQAEDGATFGAVLRDYDEAVASAARRDVFGRLHDPEPPRFGLGLTGGVQRVQGNFRDPLAEPSFGLVARWHATPRLGLGLHVATGTLAVEDGFAYSHVGGDVHALYTLLPGRPLSPFVEVGAGLLLQDSGGAVERDLFPTLAARAGIEWRPVPAIGLHLAMGNDYALIDGIDGVRGGRGHDSVWTLRAGLVTYALPF